MTEHGSAYNQSAPRFVTHGVVDPAQENRPHHCHQQAVRDGIGSEIEGRDFSEAGRDPDALDAKQQKDRPEEVEELGSENHGAQGSLGCNSLGGQRDAEMANEHKSGSQSPSS